MGDLLNYAVSCWFESIHAQDVREESTWEESILLINSTSEVDAIKEAETIARSMEASYENQFGQQVNWRFRRIGEVQHIGELRHGSELFSRHYKETEVKSILSKFT